MKSITTEYSVIKKNWAKAKPKQKTKSNEKITKNKYTNASSYFTTRYSSLSTLLS